MHAVFLVFLAEVDLFAHAKETRADAVSQEDPGALVQLFVLEGASVVRATCGDALVFDRNTCRNDRRAAPKDAVYKAVKIQSDSHYQHELDGFDLLPPLREYRGAVRGFWEISADYFNAAIQPRLRLECTIGIEE